MLPRVADSLSFLYLDAVRVIQDDTGVCARVGTSGGGDRVYLPTAALSCVLLGPGTSITQPAMATFARHGTTVVCTGSGAVRAYAGIQPSSLTTHWLERQVRAWTDDSERLAVATRMYERRFDSAMPSGASLAQLRGIEGQRVKALYRMLAQKHRIARFRRNYDPAAWDTQDPVNLALSAANVCLYGIIHSALLALGCSPALGFIHSGTQHAFIYDIADLYKAKITIPLAFAQHASTRPEQEIRRHLRDKFRLFRLLPRIVTDVQWLIDPEADREQADRSPEMVHLWDPEVGELPAGVNYADEDL
ncbi:MAG: type I-E CRISPR-associated endonuclease Cas1e [Streptosporangiaceae bacterium]